MADWSLARALTETYETRASLAARVKSSVSSYVGQTIKLTDGAFWSSFMHANSTSGQHVSARTVLSLATAWACIRLISETIATLPIDIFLRGANRSREIATDHELHELLHYQPNADMTAVEYWEVIVASLLLWGNAYSERIYSGPRLIALNFLEPHRMNVRRVRNGAIVSMEYRYTDPDGTPRVIPEDRLWHVKAFSIDGIMGLSSIRYGANTFGSAMAADEVAGRVFQNGMNAAGVLSTEQILKPEQREEYRGTFQKKFTGTMNAGGTMVLEAGMKYQRIPLAPGDAQLLETRGHNIEELCRWFRCPPIMVGHGDKQSSWPTSTEAQGMLFLTYTLRPWLMRIEQSIRKTLIRPADRAKYFAEFNADALLRADSAGRAALYASGVQNGYMNRATVAQKENLPPPTGGDIYTVQSNLVPIDQLGKEPAAEQAKSGLLTWLGFDERKSNAA